MSGASALAVAVAVALASATGAGPAQERAPAPARAAPPADPARRWVGTRLDAQHQRGLPRGVTFVAGATVGEAADSTRQSVLEVVAHGRRMLWLTARVADGARWVVTDALALPPIAPGRTLLLPGLCGRPRAVAGRALEAEDVTLDRALVAVARAEPEVVVLTRVERAWRADPTTGRLVPVATRALGALACLNDEGDV